MMGNPKVDEMKGIIPRLVESLFQGIEDADEGIEFTVKLSYVEIYNERVRDLLTARNANSDNLKIREGTHGGVYIENVVETYVNSVEQVLALMEQGQSARALAATNMNEQSSRSHSVFLLTIGQLNTANGSKKGSKLTLVDCQKTLA
jgi:kinesin family protein 5